MLKNSTVSQASSTTELSLANVSKNFGDHAALADVNLTIASGARVALIGPSGGGKTTLLRLLGTQIAATSGEVTVLDLKPEQLSERSLRQLRTRIGYLPQGLGLVSKLRVIQNVISGRAGRRSLLGTARDLLFPTTADREAIHQLLQRVGIAEKLYDRTDSLSGGQQQRVALARVLFQRPEILLADEPVSAVDPARAHSLLDLLTRLTREEDLTLVASIHHLELAKQYFDRLIGLKAGQVVYDGSPEELAPDALEDLYTWDAQHDEL